MAPVNPRTTRQAWPPTPAEVLAVIAQRESDLVEFKREWPDLCDRVNRARFAKHVLALANTVTDDRPGLVLYGVDDPSRGAALVGVPSHPRVDDITGTLQLFTQPMVEVRYATVTVGDVSLGVLGVFRSRFHPHWAARDVDEVLVPSALYVRKGARVAVATPPEVEGFFREKDRRLGQPMAPLASDPLETGFVEGGGWHTTHQAVLRVRNATDEPVWLFEVVVDVRLPLHADVFGRSRLLGATALAPSESRELEIRVDPTRLYRGATYVGDEARDRLHFRWVDLTARVTYRDRTGVLQSITRTHSLAD